MCNPGISGTNPVNIKFAPVTRSRSRNMKLRITIKSLVRGEKNVAILPVHEVKMVLEGTAKINGPKKEIRKLLLQTELNANADGSRRVWIEEL